ncbi:hypothetical protein BB559_000085 [Furculomyces boomerangus]|uniref:Uncharacterized protein n=2 Tax=Harpellales TaxID=61421 RepID=A0A2T9Z6B6_9FUNG|nr:hypothetical protein BB559_000085 [Furculomyces boomerangus]PWA00634.1 hypothetical protein BB558_003311 [Smittium angustum]
MNLFEDADIDNENNVEKLKVMLKGAKQNMEIAAQIGLNLSEQNKMLLNRLDKFEFEIRAMDSVIKTLTDNRQQIREQLLAIDKVSQDQKFILDMVSKLQLSNTSTRERVLETKKSQKHLVDEMAEIRTSITKIFEFKSHMDGKFHSAQVITNKLQNEMAKSLESRTIIENKVERLEKQVSKQTAEMVAKIQKIELQISDLSCSSQENSSRLDELLKVQNESSFKLVSAMNEVNVMVETSQQIARDLTDVKSEFEMSTATHCSRNFTDSNYDIRNTSEETIQRKYNSDKNRITAKVSKNQIMDIDDSISKGNNLIIELKKSLYNKRIQGFSSKSDVGYYRKPNISRKVKDGIDNNTKGNHLTVAEKLYGVEYNTEFDSDTSSTNYESGGGYYTGSNKGTPYSSPEKSDSKLGRFVGTHSFGYFSNSPLINALYLSSNRVGLRTNNHLLKNNHDGLHIPLFNQTKPNTFKDI